MDHTEFGPTFIDSTAAAAPVGVGVVSAVAVVQCDVLVGSVHVNRGFFNQSHRRQSPDAG